MLATLVAAASLSLPPFFAQQAQQTLSKLSASQGLVLESAQMKFSWTQGLSAEELEFSQEWGDSQRRLLAIDQASLEFAWSSFLSGQPQLRQIRVQDAQLSLLADDVPVEVSKLSGTLYFEQDWIHLHEVSALYHQLEITASGKLHRLDAQQPKPQIGRMQRYLSKQGRILARAESLMSHIQLSLGASRLELEIQPANHQAQGQSDELLIEGTLHCEQLSVLWPQQSQNLEALQASFQWDGAILEISEFTLQNQQEHLQASLRFDSRDSRWQVDASSNLDARLAAEFAQGLSSSAPQIPLWPEYDSKSGGELYWQLHASWQDQPLTESWLAQVQAIGSLSGKQLSWNNQQGSRYQGDKLSFQFAWNGQQLQISDFKLTQDSFTWTGSGSWADSQIGLDMRAEAPQSALLSWTGKQLGLKELEALSKPLISSNILVEPFASLEAQLRGHGDEPENWQVEAKFSLPKRPNSQTALDFLTPSNFQISGTLDAMEFE